MAAVVISTAAIGKHIVFLWLEITILMLSLQLSSGERPSF